MDRSEIVSNDVVAVEAPFKYSPGVSNSPAARALLPRMARCYSSAARGASKASTKGGQEGPRMHLTKVLAIC